MLFTNALFVAVAATAVSAQLTLADIKAKFEAARIIPQILPTFNPVVTLNVTYRTKIADYGTNFTTAETAQKPTFTILPTPTLPADLGTGPFLIAMVDPDGPTPQNPTLGGVRHYVGGSLTLAANGTLTGGSDLAAYFGPSPPTNSDAHRYIWFLFKQPASLRTISGGLTPFNISAFVTQYSLGAALGGNWMTVSTKR